MGGIEVYGSCKEMRSSSWHIELGDYASRGKSEDFRIIFGWTGGNTGLKEATKDKQIGFLFPPDFLDSIGEDLNGGFGRCCRRLTEASESWYTFKIKQVSMNNATRQLQYSWQQIACFTSQGRDGRICIVCLDCPLKIRSSLLEIWKASGDNTIESWNIAFLRIIKDLYNVSVWSLRDCVRNNEKMRETPDFTLLHEIARHLIHSNETLDIAVDTIECLRNGYKRAAAIPNGFGDPHRIEEFQEQTRKIEKDVKCIKRRSESLLERLQSEINLAFNLVVQKDSRIMRELGQGSRQDNNNMRSIAVVGLVYLPGTFVSGLFGMNFFQFQEQSGTQIWAVSDRFWLYWAVTVPLTLTTVVIWVVVFHWSTLRRGSRWIRAI